MTIKVQRLTVPNALLRSTKVIGGQHFVLDISLEVVLLKLSCCIVQIQYSNETFSSHLLNSSTDLQSWNHLNVNI